MNVFWYLMGCATPLVLAALLFAYLCIVEDWRHSKWVIEVRLGGVTHDFMVPSLIPYLIACWWVNRKFGRHEDYT